MLLLHLLYVALLPLLVASQDDGQSSADVLNSKDGDTPCEMRDTFPTTCTTKLPTRDAEDDNNDNNGTSFSQLTPTPCTCTNVYFNLWSACVYTKTQLANTTLPVLSSLEQKCVQASINVITKQPQADAPYPGWAFMALPASNSSFDLAAAIETASQSHKWTVIQIVLPILVGLAIGVFIIVGYIIYRRRQRTNRQRPWMQTTGNRPRFQFPSISSRHNRVRELNRSSSWSIDEREEDLGEYQFVSYPASLQGSQVAGHVRLSPSSTRSVPAPPMLEIPANKAIPVRTWPGKSIWKGPLQSALQLGESIPRPWRSTKRVAVKTVPSYSKFRVDASDSDSPLSQRTHVGSLLDRPGRSRTNLHNETIFEGEDEQDSDSDEEGLPLMPQEHSRSNHDAEPPANPAPVISPTSGGNSPNNSQRAPRQAPPASAPLSIPLPPPPPPPGFSALLTTSSQPRPQPAVRTQGSLPSPPQPTSPQRPRPAFPPAPTSPPPPPPPPTLPRRSPRSPRSALPPQFTNQPALPSPPLLSPPPPPNIPPPPRRRQDSDGSSVRSLPITPTTPTPSYTSTAPAHPQQPTAGNTPLNYLTPSVPPRSPQADSPHSPTPTDIIRSLSATARSVRRLPLPPG